MTLQPDVKYTATATAQGGREGHVRSADGLVDLDMRPPAELGGPGGAANPELLFAAGYAACFQGALGLAGKARSEERRVGTECRGRVWRAACEEARTVR